jgi:hypothetical protein
MGPMGEYDRFRIYLPVGSVIGIVLCNVSLEHRECAEGNILSVQITFE